MPLLMITCRSNGDEGMKRLFLACMLFVCLLPAVNTDSQNSQPFGGSVAVAGRSMPGLRWCACGDPAVPNCICDPGEQPCTVCPGQGLTVQSDGAQEGDTLNSVDLGAALSLVVASVILALRLRQI